MPSTSTHSPKRSSSCGRSSPSSVSMVPTTRSSEALMGSSTTRMRRLWDGRTPAESKRRRQSVHSASLSEGSQPKWQPSTTSCSGRSLASARTAVDLPVPFSPRMRTPPIVGTMALRINASFIDSWPTIAVKGKLWRSSFMLTRSRIGARRLGRDQLLDEVSLLDELLGGFLDPLLGVAVVLQPRHHLPVGAVRAHREAELKPLRHPVLPMAHHRQRVPVAPRGRGADAVDGVDRRIGRRRRRRQSAVLHHLRAARLHDLDELVLQPSVV